MIAFKAFRTFSERAAFFIATGLGSGLSPKAPGTTGSLAALALIYFIQSSDVAAHLQFLLWCILFALGSWASGKVNQVLDSSDHSQIVIDEFVGMAIASVLAQGNLSALLLSFILFRFFDIAKLPPVRQLDQWSKRKTKLNKSSNHLVSGLGVMLDDIAAGLQALGVYWILTTLKFF